MPRAAATPLTPATDAVKDPSIGSTDRAMRSDAQRNYNRLVVAAREVFAAQGGDASMEAIARQAGVGVGTLYRHFPKRIDLVEAVYRNDVEELSLAAEKAVSNLAPWDALVSWLDAFLRYALGKRVFLTELREAFEKNPQLQLSSRERVEQSFTLVLEAAQRAGVARTDVDGSTSCNWSAVCASAQRSTERKANGCSPWFSTVSASLSDGRLELQLRHVASVLTTADPKLKQEDVRELSIQVHYDPHQRIVVFPQVRVLRSASEGRRQHSSTGGFRHRDCSETLFTRDEVILWVRVLQRPPNRTVRELRARP